MLCVAFTGGGTGGHIYPGLAVASRLKEMAGCRLFWIGADTGMDRSIVEAAGLRFFGIPAGKLRRNFSLKNFTDLFRVIGGFFAARKILKRERPVLLFSKGGFVSVPPCAAASSLGLTVFTHESDFSPGLATRLNARFASKGPGRIFTAYRETAGLFPPKYRSRVTAAGNPVRGEFRTADAVRGREFAGFSEGALRPARGTGDGEKAILLVLGGSQGAVELNDLVKATLSVLTCYYNVLHQTGSNNESVPPADGYKSFPYIKDELPSVLAAADLVLGRSGAGTVWECAAAGKPMILVPLSGAGTRGDQVENARFFEKAGAARVIGPGGFDEKAAALKAAVALIAGDRALRDSMAASSAKIGSVDAAGSIARAIVEAAGGETNASH
ncbi:MAG: UDP-N-acetylglucosamine--N-acetylmuramyl-(pentapeptide) pyrophosphoryl-undecaprenol N-acetylglucosamine transferase [Treponema sp.]|jgi:UDP-N-acetylglucosamine--N-acetylmuramyl-(pentapeptide) pyrophosphoryl-undecaprenol N-acetylglucosamine transferase|nr:UDP-N-acetylglucosamine--N-acetylmuramyl-(pentapeptide) pyrophosphoryl-undecaprenol N-acetylglucosamine transferase [Treponema sp.]